MPYSIDPNLRDRILPVPSVPHRAALYVDKRPARSKLPAHEMSVEGDVSARDQVGGSEALLRRWAEAHGVTLVAAYRETTRGDGVDEYDRPARDRLMTAARAGAFDAVLVATRADLAHDEAEFDHVLDAMTEVRVRVIAIDEAENGENK